MQGRPVCLDCKHYLGGISCKAFDRIPDEIIFKSENDHTENIKGDGGIKYEPIKKNPD